MPLQLGDVSTERAQIISYDPASTAQVAEAVARESTLVRQGFIVRERGEGKVELDPPPRGPNIGVFRILSDNGDDRIVWDRSAADQVRDAFKKFKELLGKGYRAYATVTGGRKGHQIEDFDPGLEEILLVPGTVPG
jgi:hypothetical protein